VRNLGAVLDHEKPLPHPASNHAQWRCRITSAALGLPQSNWPTSCHRRLGMHHPRRRHPVHRCCARNWPTIRETKRMYRKLAGQADHPVVKNAMLELASSIGRLACNRPWIQKTLDTKRSHGNDDVVARGCSPPKAAQLVKWWPVISWSRRLPNSGEFS
jgi:hypothetical protein